MKPVKLNSSPGLSPESSFAIKDKWNARGEMFYKLNNYYDGDTSNGRAENYRIKCLELALEKYPNLILGFEIPTRSDINSFQS